MSTAGWEQLRLVEESYVIGRKPYATKCEACPNTIVQQPGPGKVRRFCSKECRSRDRYYKRRIRCSRCKVGLGGGWGRYCLECKRRHVLITWLGKHHLSLMDGALLLASQGGRCAICSVQLPMGGYQGIHVDHDHRCCPGEHSCGQCVRGFLCPLCNVGLGSFKDDPARLAGAITYLTAGARADD